MEFQLIPFVLTKVFHTSNSIRGSRRMPRMLISLFGYKDPRLSEIIRNAYHCAPSQGMTGEELHNFCKFLYSQIQSKDEEISCLIANIKELTYEVRLSRLQQQTYNDENKALSATHSQKLDVVLQQLQETKQELTDTKRKLETAETLLADANKKNSQLEAERKKNAKERKDMEDEIVLLRSDLYSGTKSLQ